MSCFADDEQKFAQSGQGTMAGLRWPAEFRPVPLPLTTLPLPSKERYLRDRRWVTTRVRDFSCSKREFGLCDAGQGIAVNSQGLKSFYNYPLFPITLSNYVTNPTRAVRKLPPVSGQLPFDVQRHPAARSHVAQSMLQRLKDDCKTYADEQNLGTVWKMVSLLDEDIEAYVAAPSAPGVAAAIAKMESLVALLTALKLKDGNYVNVGIQRVHELANEFESGSISHVDTLNPDGTYSINASSKLAVGSNSAMFAAPPPPPPPPTPLPSARDRKFVMPDQSTRDDWQELTTDDGKKYYFNEKTNSTTWSVTLGANAGGEVFCPCTPPTPLQGLTRFVL